MIVLGASGSGTILSNWTAPQTGAAVSTPLSSLAISSFLPLPRAATNFGVSMGAMPPTTTPAGRSFASPPKIARMGIS